MDMGIEQSKPNNLINLLSKLTLPLKLEYRYLTCPTYYIS